MLENSYSDPDYFKLDELITEEQKLIRRSTKEWVKREVIPIIETACQNSTFPKYLIKMLGDIGAFGSYIPAKYGS